MSAVAKVGRGRGKRLTITQQVEAAAMWALGTHTLESLSRRYGKTGESLARLFKRMGVVKGSHAKVIEERVENEMKRRIEEEATETARRVRESREDAYRLGAALAKIETNIIAENRKAGASFASINGELLAIRNASAAAESSLRLRFSALGVKNDNAAANADMPKLEIVEMSAEEAMLRRAQQMEEEEIGDPIADLEAVLDETSEPPTQGEGDDDRVSEGEETK